MTSAEGQSLIAQRDAVALRSRFGERALFDHPLAAHTSWKIGGPADVFLAVDSTAELAAVLQLCYRARLPWFVLGSGSNLLVGDGGLRGIVIRLGGEFGAISCVRDGATVVVEAGASALMPRVTAEAASHGAVGIESLVGIPGSVGGSLRMNAGTDRELGEFVREVFVQTPKRPEPHPVSPEYFYRHTTLARDAIVARAVLAFDAGDPSAVREVVQARLVRRKRTQPLAFPNAGSCFRNPPGAKAGELIERIGAKGWRVGDAQVSEVHGNFIVNLGGATASDVANLLAKVRRAVVEQTGVELELEVHFVGVFA